MVRDGRKEIKLRHPDGSTMMFPRDWTNVDGDPPVVSSACALVVTVDELRELGHLLDALQGEQPSNRAGADPGVDSGQGEVTC